MRKLIRYAAAVILLCGPAAAALQGPGFDFSAVEQTWKIAGILERDQEPDAAEWAALFQSPGYRELMRRESYFTQEGFKANFRLAFMPSQTGARKEALEKRPNSTAAHFARIAGRREGLQRLQAEMERGSMIDEALAKAGVLLPSEAMEGRPHPPIAFVFFAPDGRGYDPIIVDLLYAADKGDGLVAFMAHEIHHYCRRRVLAYDEGNVLVKDEGLLNGLTQLQIEGIADQIDKHEPFFRAKNPESSAYAEAYRKNVLESPRVLTEVNARLEDAADRPGQTFYLSDLLPQSGHPTGYFMARAIIDGGFKQAMIETVGNPFAFVYLYNRAARADGAGPVFSRKTVEFLRTLETAYCPKPATSVFRKAVAGGFDSSAVEAFWKLADTLAKGNEPSPVDWAALTSHPAYAELARHEGRTYEPDILKDRMEMVFNPTRAEELQEKLKQRSDRMASHFADLKTKRASLEAFVRSLGGPAWADRLIADIRPYLPPDAAEAVLAPLFSPVYFSPDLRYGYRLFIFDPAYGADQPASIEYHARLFALRYFREARPAYHPERLKVKHAGAMDLLETLETQGFMENIFPKNSIFDADQKRKESDKKAFEAGLADAPSAIARLDRKMAEVEATPEDTDAWLRLSTADLVLQGRPLGFFMARAIADRLGKVRLSAVLGDPFAFVRLYNEAAARSSGSLPRFSEDALRLIGRLEQEYR
ncbi:MAG: hypothetical protein JW843_12045 [Candidatus Aminicenantes bacterium]|nr:hypothetical protein [Candidatus Aminicenantes bacterium]